ncbi:MAG TPA: hypothetical protein VMJ90_04115 [Anaerolineales bacterium]|nr:hypothetical protein [Anaerolineales bacterium]
MKIVQAPRASAILYNLLVNRNDARPWLMPANICPIVPITFMKARVPFEFVDISPETLHMDLDQAGALIGRRGYGGLLYAHTYGEESTPGEFFNFAKSIDPDLFIVDDRCLCMPGFEQSSVADVMLYSTGYAKVVELNSGGYAMMDDQIDYQPVQLDFDLASHEDLEKAYKSAVQNRTRFEYRDSAWLQTTSALPDWSSYKNQVEGETTSSLARRRALNEIYSSRLPEEIQLSSQYQTWRFNVRVMDKTAILKAIFENGLFASSHYASLAGIMSEGRAPVAETLADEVINLFNDDHFTMEMADRVCDVILKSLQG